MNKPIELELSPTGNHLYIFYGGIAAGIAIPPFEFYSSSEILDENKIFIRDFNQSWYQNGLPGISKDIDSTATHIKHLIEEINPNRVFFVGNSMGGYAAIMFSELLGIGDVIAFSPQTFISPFLRLYHRDTRWKRKIRMTYIKSLLKPKIWDLKPLLLRANRDRNISILVSKEDSLDLIHAGHINNIPGVRVYELDGGGHNIVKMLRDEGRLAEIMAGQFSKQTQR